MWKKSIYLVKWWHRNMEGGGVGTLSSFDWREPGLSGQRIKSIFFAASLMPETRGKFHALNLHFLKMQNSVYYNI